jgi:DNA-binding CsgD family transcriptional regulator
VTLPHFTPREQQVLNLLIEGIVSTKDLSRALGIAPGTVKVHVHSICLKTGTNNKTAIVARLLREQHEEELPPEFNFQWRKG